MTYLESTLGSGLAGAAQELGPGPAPVARQARGAESPLSYAQQRLWLIDRVEGGGTSLYNVPVAFHLAGPGLRVSPLAGALAEIVRRHEALRTVFRESAEGEPVQVVQPFIAPMLPIIDLSGLPDARSAAGPLARELAGRPFDLARGPLLRCSLLRLGAEEHHLIVALHHIAADGWSLEILARELSELYQAFAQGLPSPLPALPVQYADFAIWQRRRLAGEVLEAELAWWRERLAGLAPALELPADRPRPARQSFRGGSRHARLAPGTGAGLATLGRRHGATPFMTTLAAFYTLLHRYTGEEDLAIGTLAAGRGNAETQGLIGFFVNDLVLRASLAGDPSFLELLARARTAVLDANVHQDLPFEQLVTALAPQRDLARTPLFQVLLTFRERAPDLKLGPELTAAMADLPTATAQLDLSLQVSRDGDELRFAAEYATDLFDAATIDRLLGHLGTLLAGIATAPETRLSLLPLLTPTEREQLAAWNATAEPRPAGATLHGLFAAQAARTPDAVAVIAREGTLTYRELDARAGRLARRLAALGAGIDSRVGLFLERSLEMVVALLGVLKAGAAYVPLDPDYPAERLAAMLEDAQAVAVLAQERLADRLPAGAPVLFLEGGWDRETGGDLPAMPALPAIVPEEAAAYLIFTSGSTGRPKAATVPHRAIVNHMLWMQAELPLGPADRVLQKTAFSFDASVWEFWAPLLAGATLVMAAPGEQREPAALIRSLREHGVTVLQAVPSLLRVLLEEGGLGECRSLRRVFCGGEALEADVQADFFAAQEAELINLYGPTETTVEVTSWRCERARASRPALLGGPIQNARLHVLGARLEPCPVGVPGELFVAGVPVSRGYLGRAAETASSFLPDPFAAAPGERLYRTGDRVRRRPDGLLEYLGRADGQVKVRGFRVELGEVEAALVQAGAHQAVVILRSDRSDGADRSVGSQLIAYVAGDATAGELRQALRERLPDYMVPALFVELPALPLTPNGKVDRRALRALPSLPGAGHEPVAPRTHREERVAGLWRDVLQVDRLGIHDNFWELGGHSLLATRLAHRVRESFGVELPVRTLFERPTLAGYTEAIAAALQGLGERAEHIAPRMDSGPAPLSHAQQRLWFLDRLQPGQAVYNLPLLFAVAGPLAADALAAALAEIVRRHDVLRTTFHAEAESGEPVQAVAGPAPWPLPRVDLAGLPPAPRAAEADRLLAAERRLPFDLARGPLLRALLVRLGPHDHRLALNLHHIVFDGWSVGVLRRELQALYGAAVTGRPSPMPELAVQYADFAVWQRRWLAGGEQEAQLAWWRQTLAGTPPALDLPTDRPRPAVLSPRGGLETLPLGAALSAELARLGRRRGATQFMTLLAGFAALLCRYTGQEDLWLGTPIANRQHAETENLLGFFANTLVLRLDLRGDPAFAELLGYVRETALAAYAHQDLPFDKLVEELAPARDLSRMPLFQVVFAAESERAAPAELAPGVTLGALAAEVGSAKFDLLLTVKPGPEGLEATAEWATDLFDAATIRRLLAGFRRLLAEAAADPGTRISELPLLAAEEREQVLHAWNDTATPYPREATIPGLFEEQARRTPDALAVVGGGEELTYGELSRRAERLAGWLLAAGLAPDEAVGLCAERSADLIAALLGILKAGGAYVPLDPSYPRERLAGMLADAGARIVVAQEGLEDVLPESGAKRLPLRGTLGAEGGTPARPDLHPEQLAYVLFTSGSTGRPKGVAVTHRNVVRLVRETNYLRFSPEEVFLQLAPVSFDASTLEIWGPLLNGGRLALAPPGPLDLSELGGALERYGVTTLWLTAGLFHQMVESHLDGLRPVRQLAAGGDVLAPDLVRRALAGLPGTTLVNGYGPTEGTTFTCCHVMRSAADLGAGSVPIGRPITNTRVYLLDATLRPVPVGVVGQLYAAGDGLARGYAGRPELTAERFVPDPVSGEPGTRLYATGDLARWRPSGEIEFLGRADAQVKIRGFRIEPGEIEAVLAQHPEVETAAVIAREDVPGDKRLVAYVVPALGSSPQPAALRAWLAERLPSYMVPAAFVALAELPLGPTGKVDRRALPAPAAEPYEAEPAGERSPVEELLADIWADLLGAPGVPSHTSFFELGGHSLLAVRLASRVHAVLGVDVDLRTVFERPTVAGLAAWIEAAARGGRPAAAPVVPLARGAESPLSYAQQRLWLVDRFESGGTALYNVPVAFHLAGPGLRVAALELALDEVVRRHEALRTVFRESADGEPVQVVQPFLAGPLPVIDLAGLPDARTAAAALARELARRPFDLARGPLLRRWLLRLDGEEHQLVVSMHHIASDGWSIEILVREISELYQTFAQGLPSPLPPLPVQYADYALWQRRRLAGEVLETELAWWRARLAGMPPALELPADRPRPARQGFRGGLRHRRLEPGAGAGLAALSRHHGATLFMTLAATFDTLLLRYTGEEDLAAGTPIAGRGGAEIQGLIGFFVNTLVLRTSLAGDPSFRELLARVRATALDAYAHQELPFEQLVAALAPQRDHARTPLFQVVFALHETPAHELRLGPALTGAMAEVPTATAKFDLYLHVARDGDELRAAAEYAADLFDAATVDRLLGHLSTLLAGIAAAPETRLSLLPLLAPAERAQLRSLWSGGEPAPLPAPTLPGLFAAQAARTPGALALVCGRETLTYAELDARSAALARRLRRLGVGPEVPVGVCLPRTADLVVGLLAVLRAGGFYVPLDPAYPAERLGYMLADSRCRLALTTGSAAAVLPTGAVRLLRLDDPATPPTPADIALDAGPGDDAGDPEVLPNNLAYLIYTSGSTGRPKAVAIEHRSAALLTGWARNVFSPAELAGVVASTSIAFDVSVFELFATLTSGGTVILVENALAIPALKNPGALPAGVEARLAPMVPSAAAELLHSGGLPATVATLNLGGEALPRALAQRAYERPETARVYNLYGPSEDTTYSTFALIGRGPGRTSPIGRPVDGTRAYVLDRRLQPMPAGVPGELYLAGGGLARGYLGRPELTAERFLPDPLADEPGARMYKTGDLTLQRAGGELEYLGRIDRQVKVRGFRIELGEVEAAIAAHPGVQAVAAMVREDQPGDRRLVAYVVADGEAAAPAEIRRTVQARLPEAMTPSHILLLAALPLSPNGKVDHGTLPAPEAVAGDGPELAAPRTHLEERLADLWRSVLNVERLGIHDSFWELGGHSLPAARLAHRVREIFGVELPVRTLFERPTLAEHAAAIAEALQGPGEGAQRMAPRVGDGPAPLSYAQQRLWLLDRLQPGQAVYNLPILFAIAGPLAADALAAALAEIARRHGVLRTTFAMDAESGEPVQAVAAAPVPLPRVDLAALPAARRTAETERLLAAERHRPFDLARGPLLRALLVRLGPHDHRLALNFHHIVFDGWSIGVLRRELQALYGAAAAGRPSPLPELAIQYADFSAWQRQWLAGGELAAQLAWWRHALAGDPPALDLPTDRPRPAVQSLRGGLETLPLGPALSAAVEQLGQHRGATPFMTLLAAFKALLFRYTGQEDLWLGTPIANRAHAETEDLLGFFVNTLVLRTSLEGDPAFSELLGRVRETALAAYAHQDLPFERLVEELAPARDLSRSPLFQVMFAYEGEPMATAELAPGVTLEPLDVTLDAAKFDLTLGVESGPAGLTASLEYAADLFDAATARRLLAHFHLLLAQAAGDPEARITELPLLTPAEREEVVAAGRRTAAPVPGERVHRLFEAQAQSAPEALAVTWWEGCLTYGELDRRANWLAHRLRELGTGPESVVAILLERSPELVTAVLATAKAGGAWLPIDPAYPSERIATMLRDARVSALLTTSTQLAHAPDLPILLRRVVRMDGPDAQAESPAPPLAGALDPDHLAYVIYTSGSTGTPKGTELTHRGLANLVAWHQRAYELSPADRSPLVAGPGFDASVWEMWPALATGASLHLPPPDTIPSPAALLAWLAAESITVAFLPTPLAEAVLEEAQSALPPAMALRAILTGGDRLLRRPSPDLPFTLINHYGPTESTVVATSGIVTTTGVRPPDIGAAIANTQVHLLDRTLRPVPVGLPGELCIAGAGLARGYRRRPELTAERFVPNPLGEEPGERLYRTGDLARWLPGGLVEFLGRIDHQVKIRGIRIELGEIESALNAQPDIAAAVVMAREESTGDRRLVAYVVAPAGLDPAELRERLARRLPAAMVPAAWVFLDALPLTPNGKVDRRALPAPEPMRADWEFIAPRTPIEEQVADIWRTVLTVDRVGVYDNFWDLGGHSLLATKVLARIRDAFGIDLPLKTLFTAPSLGELTTAVGQGLLTAHGDDAAGLLSELEGLSEDEIRSLLAAEAEAVEELT